MSAHNDRASVIIRCRLVAFHFDPHVLKLLVQIDDVLPGQLFALILAEQQVAQLQPALRWRIFQRHPLLAIWMCIPKQPLTRVPISANILFAAVFETFMPFVDLVFGH